LRFLVFILILIQKMPYIASDMVQRVHSGPI
jgi:hypothetical protein